MLAFVFSLALMAATEPSAGGDPTPAKPAEPTATQTTAEKPAGDRLVCRRETRANSRFTTKVCKTADEWEARTEEARRAFAEIQQRPMTSLGKGN